MEDRIVDSEDEGNSLGLVVDFQRLNGLIKDLPLNEQQNIILEARKFDESGNLPRRTFSNGLLSNHRDDILQTIQDEIEDSQLDEDDDFGLITFNPDGTVLRNSRRLPIMEEEQPDMQPPNTTIEGNSTSHNELREGANPPKSPSALPQNTIHVHTKTTETNTSTHRPQQDDIDLRNFMTANEGYFRRGLRKRKFSSTHPYLADQAHWLGLMSANQLNEIFDESQDMELVVKVLNQRYMQRRKKYPKDEKYKSKNFYAYIGKKQGSSQQSVEKNANEQESNPETQNFYPEGYSDSDDDIFHPSISRKNTSLLGPSDEESANENPHDSHLSIQSPETQNFDDDENSPSDSQVLQSESDLSPSEFVSVGGKMRKEKSILKGALPESFRRMANFKPRPNLKKNEPKLVEMRKGLAVKKHGSSTKHANLDLLNFVDDEVYYREGSGDPDDPTQYWGLDKVFEANELEPPSVVDHDIQRIERVSSFRSPLPFLTNDSDSSLEELGFQKVGYHSDSDTVVEEDFIDPIFANSSGRGNWNLNGTPRSRTHNNHSGLTRTLANLSTRNYSREYSHSSGSKVHRNKKAYNSHKKRPLKPSHTGTGNIKRRKFSFASKNPTKRPLNIPSSPSTTEDKENQPEKVQPADRHQLSIRELLGHEYHFKREPAKISTDFELESKYLSLIGPVSFNVSSRIASTIKAKADFFDIDIKKIHALDEGFHSFFPNRDSVVFTMVGKRYAFVLVDKVESAKTSDRFFIHLRKIMRDESLPKILDEIYKAIRHIIEWFLILQEKPGDSTLRYLAAILQEITSYEAITLFSPLIVLQLIFDKLESRSRPNSLQKTFDDSSRRFWKLFFPNTNASTLANAIQLRSSLFESVHLAVILQSTKEEPHGFWPLVNYAVKECENVSFEILTLFAATFSSGTAFWHPFLEVYGCSKSKESEPHNQFLGAILYLHKRHHWSLEERVITEIYLTIVKRRFANFVDEKGPPQLLGIIHSGNEFGSSLFIERFMRLLYGFISGLPVGPQKKRLISKLISSSQYHYENGNSHYAMFVNRVNFLLLLAQVSQAEVSGHVLSLVKLVETSRDVRIYETVVSFLRTFSDICTSRLKTPPVEIFLLMIDVVSRLYVTLPGIQRLSKSLLGLTENIFLQNASVEYMMSFVEIFMELDLKLMPDEIGLRVSRSLTRSIRYFCKSELRLTSKQAATLSALNDKLAASLNTQMGRVQYQQLAPTLDLLIEEQIASWLGCTSLVENNWNRILLQQYPYLGNSYLRGRYLLLLYTELLNYDGWSEHKDSIIVAILRELAKPTPSVYTAGLYSQLRKKAIAFNVNKTFVPENILASQLEFFHRQIVLNAIYSIAQDTFTSLAARTLYIEELTASLDALYTSNYSNSELVDFCKQLTEAIQKYCYESVKNSDTFWTFCGKLGVVKRANRVNFHNLNLKEKLSVLHDELLSALHFEKDYLCILDAYIDVDSMTLAYDLTNIYLRAIASEQSDKWALLACLITFIWTKMSQFSINIADFGFRRLLRMLPNIGSLFCIQEKGTYKSHKTKTVATTAMLLNRSVLTLDGYRDRDFVLQTIEAFLQPFDGDTTTSEPMNTCGLILFDIQLSKNVRYVPKDENTGREDIGAALASLKECTLTKNETGCMEFEL